MGTGLKSTDDLLRAYRSMCKCDGFVHIRTALLHVSPKDLMFA